MTHNGWRGAWALLGALLAAGCDYGPDSEAGTCPFGNTCGNAVAGNSAGATVETGFRRSGTGDAVVQLPANVTLVRISATPPPGRDENFMVRQGDSSLVNTELGPGGDAPTLSGTHAVEGGQPLEIMGPAVAWTVTSVLITPPSDNGFAFEQAGTGAAVFLLPARSATYRVTASMQQGQENFFLYVNGRSRINRIVGPTADDPIYDGVLLLEASATVEITRSVGVQWRVKEQP